MGLLDHLWDETVAGPRPESGHGKLRKCSSFSPSSSSSYSSSASTATAPWRFQLTRSIAILRTASCPRSTLESASPSSPASVPDSPLAPTGLRGEWKRLGRTPKPVAEGVETAEPRNPTVYDWMVISSLDR